MRFYGFFKESVVESRLENFRIKKITIFYYLEDKSIMVTEPKQVNSGTPQGVFLKRQVVLKPDGSGQPFMPEDFGIGIDIGIFGRQVRINDCDSYTRQYYEVSFGSPFLAAEISFQAPPPTRTGLFDQSKLGSLFRGTRDATDRLPQWSSPLL